MPRRPARPKGLDMKIYIRVGYISRFILHLPFTGRVRAATGAHRGRRPQDSPPSLGGRRQRNRCGCSQQLPPPGAAGRHPKEPLRPPAAADPRSRRCPQQLHSPQAPTREIQRLLGRARPGQSAEATAASPSSRSEVRFRSPKVMIDCAKC